MTIPTHVSIIMDGNGRWAKARGKERIYGHFEGVESVRAVTEYCVEKGIRYLTLYAFSEENWSRPADEVNGLMELMLGAMVKELPTFAKNGVHFRVLGNLGRLSDKMRETIDRIDRETASNSKLDMILMISYSGKWDILQAVQKVARELPSEAISELTISDFDKYLVTAGIPDPDVLIRTSGEKRLSNYMLWQSAYTEFVFVDTLWPDFRKEQFAAALEEYSLRDRRFGKVK